MAAGAEVFIGTSAQTIAGLTQAAVVVFIFQPVIVQTIASLTQAATGVYSLAGPAGQTLASLSQVAAGAEVFLGSAGQTLASFTQIATEGYKGRAWSYLATDSSAEYYSGAAFSFIRGRYFGGGITHSLPGFTQLAYARPARTRDEILEIMREARQIAKHQP